MPELEAHSPLGASGAYRWMVCPGSVQLSKGIVDEESEFAAEGTAAHSLGDSCLKQGDDAWQRIGTIMGGYPQPVSKDMADAVQVYLNHVRAYPDRDQSNWFVERSFHCPELHPLFYGTADNVFIDEPNRHLYVDDYKHGAGIVVEAKNNPQGMYYAAGVLEMLELWGKVDTITIGIIQPRGFHYDGPIRQWSISVDDLKEWLHDTLIPAMETALVSRETKSGDHCRFCPARGHACPQLVDDMKEMEELMGKVADQGGAKALTNAELGRFLVLFDTAKIVAKAAGKTAFSRLQAGKKVPGRKLAKSKTNRTWKEGSEAAIIHKLGEKAMTESVLKSPAKIDALPGGKDLTAQHAYKPEGGLTVVSSGDTRKAQNTDVKGLFKPVTK